MCSTIETRIRRLCDVLSSPRALQYPEHHESEAIECGALLQAWGAAYERLQQRFDVAETMRAAAVKRQRRARGE